MRLCSIASGSSGNCIYVGNDTTHLLVDTGISGKKIEEGLSSLDLAMKDMDGILITHEHSDHISGLGVAARKCRIPIYATKGTIKQIKKTKTLGEIPQELFCEISEDQAFWIRDMEIVPMRISHDAAQPVAYRFFHENKKAAIVTDLGIYDEYTVECLKGMDVLLMEANHDVRMLETGPYPYYLKQRILGNRGHLSNELAGRLLSELWHDGLKKVVLGHLSRENNMAELAYETVRVEIMMANPQWKESDLPLMVANRNEASEVIEL